MIENHVTSLELSKKLKEAGVKQESCFYYANKKGKIVASSYKETHSQLGFVSAFLASELGEMVKDHMSDIRPCNAGWEVFRHIGQNEKEYLVEKNMSNAMAKMLLYLLENNLIPLTQ